MTSIEDLYLLNLVVTVAMLTVLTVRAYLEYRQIKTYIEETECKNRLRRLHVYVKSEKKEILSMPHVELEDFLDNLIESLLP